MNRSKAQRILDAVVKTLAMRTFATVVTRNAHELSAAVPGTASIWARRGTEAPVGREHGEHQLTALTVRLQLRVEHEWPEQLMEELIQAVDNAMHADVTFGGNATLARLLRIGAVETDSDRATAEMEYIVDYEYVLGQR